MDEERFWEIVDQACEDGEGNPEERCDALRSQLEELSPQELRKFDGLMRKQMARAYSWDLWAAAYVVRNGCSDDSFADFRATLISLGRDTFEGVLEDPDTLADLDVDDIEDLFYEGFQNAAAEVFEENSGEEMPASVVEDPDSPCGTPFDEDDDEDLARRFPRLWEQARDRDDEDDDGDDDDDEDEEKVNRDADDDDDDDGDDDGYSDDDD